MSMHPKFIAYGWVPIHFDITALFSPFFSWAFVGRKSKYNVCSLELKNKIIWEFYQILNKVILCIKLHMHFDLEYTRSFRIFTELKSGKSFSLSSKFAWINLYPSCELLSTYDVGLFHMLCYLYIIRCEFPVNTYCNIL